MIRRSLVVLVAALLLCAVPWPTASARDEASSATKAVRKQFRVDAKEAERVLASAASNFSKQLAGGGDVETAAAGYGNALAFFANTISKLAAQAGADAQAQVAQLFDATGDDGLPGGLVGDGGSLQKFGDLLQKDLDKLRKKAIARTKKVRSAVAKNAPTKLVRMHATFPTWVFERSYAPAGGTSPNPADTTIRVWATLATRLVDGRVAVTVAGTAPRSRSGEFDVRLNSGGPLVEFVGEKLAGGGMPVADGDVWAITTTIGDPMSGVGVDSGNRSIQLGVDPDPDAPGGPQPTRLQQAGHLSIP